MNIFSHPRFRIGWVLIAIATISSIGWSLVRWAYENSLVNTQLTVDYDDTRSFADAVQVPHAKLLEQLKSRGVSSVALYQQNLGSLRDNGRIVILTREEAEAQYPRVDWKRYALAYRFVIVASAAQSELLQQIYSHLLEQSQPGLLPKLVEMRPKVVDMRPIVPGEATAPPLQGIFLPASRQLISDAQVGFDPAQVQVLQKLNLRVTARLSNSLNLNLDRLRQRLDEAAAVGAKVVIFSEDEVVGYQSLIPMVSRELKNRGMLFGAIEFSKQRGLEEMMTRSDGMLARVHSVAGDEAAKAKKDVLVERYVRAIKERNIRVAYIRMVRQLKGEWEIDAERAGTTRPGGAEAALKESALTQNLDFIAQISRELQRPPIPGLGFLRPGLKMSDAHGFRDFPHSWLRDHGLGETTSKIALYLMRFVAGFGAIGAAWLLLNLFLDISPRQGTNLLIFGFFCCAVLAVSAGKGAQLLALAIGCMMTPVALLWGGLPGAWDAWRQDGRLTSAEFAGHVRPGAAFSSSCGVLLRTSALTLCGGLMTVALLNKWTYMSKADEYFGEKATLLAPLIIVGIAFAGKIFPHRVIVDGSAIARRQATERLNKFLDDPFTVRYLMVGLLVAVAGFVWIARTGNDSGMDISPLELKMRAFMEQVFITRPRTKEVFVGNPALILAVFLGWKRRWPLFLALTIAATVGQADLYNTMCHIHTPLFYSLLRSLHAVWLGIVIGGVMVWLWDWVEKSMPRRDDNRGTPTADDLQSPPNRVERPRLASQSPAEPLVEDPGMRL